MSSNRYGQIWHSERNPINIRFPSGEARREFEEKFNAYHASHDHDGEPPRFEVVNASDIKVGSAYTTIHDVGEVTIDGYKPYEIQQYHEKEYKRDHTRYSPPTCCVAPVIAIDRKFMGSGDLQRHELSAIFGDMPEKDYKSLLESVESDGFIDEIIRIYEGKILDGWHRYRAAQELNLIRLLRFQKWNNAEHMDGDPKVFVVARNIERRHYSASQRAQIVVSFNERFGHGGDRSKTTDGDLKTHQELADSAGVSPRTIDRAVAVEKAGQSEAVISGEKSASEVLLQKERDRAQASEVEMWKAFEKSLLSKFLEKDDLIEEVSNVYQYPSVFPDPQEMLKPSEWISRFNRIQSAIENEDDWVKALLTEFSEDDDEVDEYMRLNLRNAWKSKWLPQLVDVFKAHGVEYAEVVMDRTIIKDYGVPYWEMSSYQLQRLISDAKTVIEWHKNPEIGWKRNRGENIDWALEVLDLNQDTDDDDPQTLNSLWDQVSTEMKAWKQRDKEKCPNPEDSIGHASKTMLVEALRLHNQTESTGAATTSELKQLLELMKEDNFAFTLRVRKILKASEPKVVDVSTETAAALIESFFSEREALEAYYITTRYAQAGVDYYKVRSAAKNEFGIVGSQSLAGGTIYSKGFKTPKPITNGVRCCGKSDRHSMKTQIFYRCFYLARHLDPLTYPPNRKPV